MKKLKLNRTTVHALSSHNHESVHGAIYYANTGLGMCRNNPTGLCEHSVWWRECPVYRF